MRKGKIQSIFFKNTDIRQKACMGPWSRKYLSSILAYFPVFNGKFSHEYNEEEWNMKSEVLFTIQKYYPVLMSSTEME